MLGEHRTNNGTRNAAAELNCSKDRARPRGRHVKVSDHMGRKPVKPTIIQYPKQSGAGIKWHVIKPAAPEIDQRFTQRFCRHDSRATPSWLDRKSTRLNSSH